jgi:aminopeptidase YwaD
VSNAGGVRRLPGCIAVCLAVCAGALTGCETSTDAGEDPAPADPSATSSPRADPSEAPTSGSTASPTTSPTGGPTRDEAASPSAQPRADRAPAAPVRFRRERAMGTIRWLADEVGPREGSSAAFRRAARRVARRFDALGYDVQRQSFAVPAGVSWGVPVPSGRSTNVIAAPEGFRAGRPHLLVGAHLDTVPQAPGAEDNASGVSVVLELARIAARDDTRLPVVFVAFGAEEPRGDGDALHHFGSTAYVNRMTPRERRGLQAMVSLDRVGVGTVVPVCTGGLSPLRVRAMLVRVAQEMDVPVSTCSDNAASDHWSFEKAGEPAARIGSTPYAGYHSAQDVPAVVNPAQIGRVGRVMWDWMSR